MPRRRVAAAAETEGNKKPIQRISMMTTATSSILQTALIVLVIASPGMLLRGLRSLLVMSYRPNG